MKFLCSILLIIVLHGSIFPAGSEETSPLILILENNNYLLPAFMNSKETNPPTYIGYNGFSRVQTMVKFCPPTTRKEKEAVKQDMNKYQSCLFPAKSNEITSCNGEINPIIIKQIEIRGDHHTKCGEKGTNSKMYEFAYHLCFLQPWNDYEFDQKYAMRDEFIAIYHFCYDHDHKGTTYIKYEISSPALLKEPLLENERKFTTSLKTDDYGLFRGDFKKMAASYEKMVEAISQDEMTRNKDIEIVEQLMVSPNDMAFAVLRKPFFHYVNVQIVWQEMAKIWDEMDAYILDITEKHLGRVPIITGVLHKHKGNKNKKFYLNTARIWWKLVYSKQESDAIAIIMHNLSKYDQSPEPLCENICAENGLENLIPPGMENRVYCCPPQIITEKMQLPDVKTFNLKNIDAYYMPFFLRKNIQI